MSEGKTMRKSLAVLMLVALATPAWSAPAAKDHQASERKEEKVMHDMEAAHRRAEENAKTSALRRALEHDAPRHGAPGTDDPNHPHPVQ